MDIDSVLKGHGIGVGGGSNIKSIQRGVATITNPNIIVDIPISSINPNKSIILVSESTDSNSNTANIKIKGIIASSTSIELTRFSKEANLTVSWQVIEFTNIKSLQKGDFVFTEQTEVTCAISAINPSKSILYFSFKSDGGVLGAGFCSARIVNSTTIAFLCLSSLGHVDTNWQIVEFN